MDSVFFEKKPMDYGVGNQVCLIFLSFSFFVFFWGGGGGGLGKEARKDCMLYADGGAALIRNKKKKERQCSCWLSTRLIQIWEATLLPCEEWK